MPEPFQLTTERLILRPHREADAQFMVDLNADPEVTRFTSNGPFDGLNAALELVRELQRQFLEHRMGRFIVLQRDSRELMGWCGLKRTNAPRTADLGYRFMARWWGQGFATEAARECVRYGFDILGLESLSAEVEVGNLRSLRVLQKLGFQATDPMVGNTEMWGLRRSAAAPR